jgi:hypothetical protein
MESLRRELMEEMLQTERQYVRDLHILVDVCGSILSYSLSHTLAVHGIKQLTPM